MVQPEKLKEKFSQRTIDDYKNIKPKRITNWQPVYGKN